MAAWRARGGQPRGSRAPGRGERGRTRAHSSHAAPQQRALRRLAARAFLDAVAGAGDDGCEPDFLNTPLKRASMVTGGRLCGENVQLRLRGIMKVNSKSRVRNEDALGAKLESRRTETHA